MYGPVFAWWNWNCGETTKWLRQLYYTCRESVYHSAHTYTNKLPRLVLASLFWMPSMINAAS